MLYLKMKLTFIQMCTLGMHLGHTLSLSKFLAYWVYGGWRANLFIINLMKTSVILKTTMGTIESVVSLSGPMWFVNLDKSKSSWVSSYAMLAGESYSSYSWMNGSMTNYFYVFGWYRMMYHFVKLQKYKLRHRDKMKMLSYFGFVNHSSSCPALGFVTSSLVSWNAMKEFWMESVPCAAMADSNTLSWNISLPIAGNDDSLICLNYYCYFFTSNVVFAKAWNIMQFKSLLKWKSSSLHMCNDVTIKKKMLLIYFYKFGYHKDKLKDSSPIYNKMRESFMQNAEKPADLENFNWKVKNLKYYVKMFNVNYGAIYNNKFFDFFGMMSENKTKKKDMDYYKDPYKLF